MDYLLASFPGYTPCSAWPGNEAVPREKREHKLYTNTAETDIVCVFVCIMDAAHALVSGVMHE